VLGYGFWWDEHGNFTEEDSHELGLTLALSRRLARRTSRCYLHLWLWRKENHASATNHTGNASAGNSYRDATGQPHFRQ